MLRCKYPTTLINLAIPFAIYYKTMPSKAMHRGEFFLSMIQTNSIKRMYKFMDLNIMKYNLKRNLNKIEVDAKFYIPIVKVHSICLLIKL